MRNILRVTLYPYNLCEAQHLITSEFKLWKLYVWKISTKVDIYCKSTLPYPADCA